MNRKRNSGVSGGGFSEKVIGEVWAKAIVVNGWDKNVWRKDVCKAAIRRADYGETSKYGWEIDHNNPVSNSGSDDLDNLQPLQWENNRHKADNYPDWACKLSYDSEKKSNV